MKPPCDGKNGVNNVSKICPSCHHELQDDAKFCNNCGAQQPPLASSQQSAYQRPSQGQNSQNQSYNQGPVYTQGQGGSTGHVPPGTEEVFTAEDVQKNKVIAALAYIIFFLPLIAAPDSRFGKFHANQGLLLLILSVVGNIILGIIPFFDLLLVPLFSIFCFVLFIMGLVNTLNGKARELPLIGQYRIIN